MRRAGLWCAAVLLLAASAVAQHAPHRVIGGDYNAADPAVSPDGSRLACAGDRSGAFRILVHDLKRGGVRQLTDGPGEDRRPSWSSNGERILFTSTNAGENALFEIESDGTSRPRRIADAPARAAYGVYGPRDRALLLVRLTERGAARERAEIILQPLTNGGAFADRILGLGEAPRFSPDGRHIVFVSRHGRTGDICIMRADGEHRQALSSGPGDHVDPCFSPDGRRIAFACDRTGNFEIYVMDKDASRVRQLTSHPAADTQPCWSADGSIYFTRRPKGGKTEIHRIDAPRN